MPYQEESQCLYNDFGKCIPIDIAYKEARTGQDFGGTKVNGNSEESLLNNFNNFFDNNNNNNNNHYRQEIYNKQKQLIRDSKTPLLAPAQVYRVLVLPYKSQDSSIWHEPKYVYYVEQEPKWVLDEINIPQAGGDMFDLF
jgi:hypothetical protein